MKNLFLTVVFLTGFLLVGCQDSNINPVSPSENQPAVLKGETNSNSSLHKASDNLITIFQTIDGSQGGNITVDRDVVVDNRIVHVNADLDFSQGSFDGVLDITMIIDLNDASITFLPHMDSFNANVNLDVTITGLDLGKLNLDQSKFVYFAYFNDAGIPVEKISSKKVHVDYKSGTLTVNNAELKHFSRYAWAT